MALIVGNLLTDPDAQSFIGLVDAVAYLSVEGQSAWLEYGAAEQEASLVSASRWMAGALPWCATLTDADLIRVGRVAARLATVIPAGGLYASADARGNLKRVKAGSAELEWSGTDMSAYQAGGRYWPWLATTLKGLICQPSSGIGIWAIG